MAVAGLYRRALPSPPAIEFASAPGKQLFAEALEKGNMEGFFQLISYYQTQSEPAYCGLASLAMVLNALAIDPGRKWKGPWRWFDDSMLDCCEPLEKVKVTGITFGNLACLAHCNGAKVEAFRTNESTIADFRKHIMLCTSSEDCHVITSYHRAHLEQTGTGHFSPIGGYHADRDMVLILDVARFKYPPHWVPLALLWKAMDTLDKATGQCRGFMIISRLHKAPSVLYTVNCRNECWRRTTKYLSEDVPLLLKLEDIKDVKRVLSSVFTSLPGNMGEFIKWVAEVRRQEDGNSSLREEEKGRVAVKEEVLKLVRETELFKHVTRLLACENPNCTSITSSNNKDVFCEIAANVCCQGAELLTGKIGSSDRSCCRETNMKVLKANGEKPVTMVSGTVIIDGSEQVVDILVPSTETITTTSNSSSFCCSHPCNFSGVLPSTCYLLTVLLLALPQHTWSGIKEEKLRDEISDLVSMDNLPPLLQAEVLHLRRQLHFLTTDLGAPSL